MEAYYLTDIGRKRSSNQDYMFISERSVGSLPNLFIVADGMGGYAAGDLASKMAVETIVEYIETHPSEDHEQLLRTAIERANAAIRKKAATDPVLEGMGTTVVAAVVDTDHMLAANVGDSRLYVKSDSLRQVTTDHSYVQEMVRMGRLKNDEAASHPDKNVITRAVGAEDDINVDIFKEKVYPGEILLLCSDGLTNMVPDAEIVRILGENTDLTGAGNMLVDQANEKGGKDNITVVLVRI